MGFVTNDPNRRWSGAIIPYEIGANILPADRTALLEAIFRWNDVAAIRLLPRQGQPNYLEFLADQPGTGGHAHGGPNSGRAAITMDFRWGDGGNMNVMLRALMHEIGHIVGLIHEHQRPDRNQYITLNDPNPNNGDTMILYDGRMIGRYDCASVMHYAPVGQPTDPIPKPGGCAGFGRIDDPTLSQGDLATLRFLAQPLLHTVRSATSWTPWGDVMATVDGYPGDLVAFDAVGIAADLHLCARSADGKVWHTIRSPGTWTPWSDVLAVVPGQAADIVELGCASVGGLLHLCARTADGRLLHTIRQGAQWQPWGDVRGAVAGYAGTIVEFDCAGIGAELHVVVRTSGDRILHTIRSPNAWQSWGDVRGAVAGNAGTIVELACASIGTELHLCVRASDGRLWHTIRYPDRWQSWSDVLAAVPGSASGIVEFDCADVGGQLHLCARGWDNGLWHTIRYTDRWQPWGDVRSGLPGDEGTVVELGCAGVVDRLHLLARR